MKRESKTSTVVRASRRAGFSPVLPRAWTDAAGVILIGLAVVVAFWPSLGGGFLWDDDSWIAATPSVPMHRLMRDDAGLLDIWLTAKAEDYWPLTNSLFWIEWRLWGMNPAGYRAVNLLLHGIGSVLVWRVLRRLRLEAAWLGAVLFAVHPVTVASVAWISELKNCLSLPLYAAALLAWLRFDEGGQRRWYAASLVAFVLALLAKTSTVVLPVVLLACCWWRRGRIDRRDLLRTAAFFVPALLLGGVTMLRQSPHIVIPGEPMPDGLLSRIAASGWVVWFYLGKALLPLRLAMLYPRWQVDPTSPTAWLPLAAAIGAAVAIPRLPRRVARPVAMAMGCYVVALGPVLGIVNMLFRRYSLVSDHLQYLALPAITALVATAVMAAAKITWLRPTALGAGGMLVAALMALTWQRSEVFRSTESLMRDSLVANPDSWAAHTNLGVVLIGSGRMPEGIEHYREALRLMPTSAKAHNNLGSALFSLGRPQEAIPHYQEALRINPNLVEIHSNLGVAFGIIGRPDEAIPHLQEAVRTMPASAQAHNNLAHALVLQGRLGEAVDHYEESLRLNPDHSTARDHLQRLREVLEKQQNAPHTE